MDYDYESLLTFSFESHSDDTDDMLDIKSATVKALPGVTWYLHAQNKLKRGKYTDATLEFNMTCTQDHVDKGLSYNIEISSLCPSKKEGFVNIANVSTCKQIIFVTQPQKQKVRMISVAGSSVANLVEMPSLAPFQDIVDVESPVVLHAKVTLRSSSPLSPLTKLLSDLAAPEFADFTFQIGDEELKANKFILSTRSPVFRAMFSNDNYEESKASVMKIIDATIDIFKMFLEFLYTARVPGNLSLLKTTELLKVAHKYDVEDLKKICDDILIVSLNDLHPVHEIYQLAHTYNCSHELIQRAFNFVKSRYFKGKHLHSGLVDNPEMVKDLVTKMESFDESLRTKNMLLGKDEALEAQQSFMLPKNNFVFKRKMKE